MRPEPTTRHVACPGCCACLGVELPIVPLSPATPNWLLPDTGDLYRPADYLAVDVVHDPVMTATAKVEACRAFMRAHGERALLDALERAATIRGLPDELFEVYEKLRVRAGWRTAA